MFLIAILVREKQKQRDNPRMFVVEAKNIFHVNSMKQPSIGGELHGS